jgi:anionic cell wall polymer biosynthesis LytR-Cps2A-Psr (LCP) family protein
MDRVNHAVGGVEVTIEDDLTSIDPSMKKGAVVKLADDQVERYLRARMTVGDGTNISRMRRQRQYMQNLYTLITGRLKEKPNYINEIYDDLSEVIDSDLPHREVSQLTAEIMEFESLGFMTIDGESGKGKAFYDGEVHAEFYPETESILQTLEKFTGLSEG